MTSVSSYAERLMSRWVRLILRVAYVVHDLPCPSHRPRKSVTVMSYLLRVQVPDTPGTLGALAAALGSAGANIRSMDVITHGEGYAIDDIVVDTDSQVLPDKLISAAQGLPNVQVDSLRPYSGSVDRDRTLELLSDLATKMGDEKVQLETLCTRLPQVAPITWAIIGVIDGDGVHREFASMAAPEDDGEVIPAELGINAARVLDAENDPWLPEGWTLMDSPVVGVSLGRDRYLFVGRTGGPDFLAAEVIQFSYFGAIANAVLRRPRKRS